MLFILNFTEIGRNTEARFQNTEQTVGQTLGMHQGTETYRKLIPRKTGFAMKLTNTCLSETKLIC